MKRCTDTRVAFLLVETGWYENTYAHSSNAPPLCSLHGNPHQQSAKQRSSHQFFSRPPRNGTPVRMLLPSVPEPVLYAANDVLPVLLVLPLKSHCQHQLGL